MSVGDVVTFRVTDVADYACWGVVGKHVGFIHLCEWSWERPVPEHQVPHVGEDLLIKVIHLTDCPYDQLPADVTFGGKFKVDFGASIKSLHPENDPWREPNAYQIGEVFVGLLEEVNSFGCWVRHPRGASGRLLVDGVAQGLGVGQQVKVIVLAVNPQKRSLDLALYT